MCANCLDEGTCINKPNTDKIYEEITDNEDVNDAAAHLDSETKALNDILGNDGEIFGFNDHYKEIVINFLCCYSANENFHRILLV